MDGIYLEGLIKHLQKQLEEHGNLPVYFSDDGRIDRETGLPSARKIYTHSWGFLSDGDLDEADEELHEVVLEEPIVKAIII